MEWCEDKIATLRELWNRRDESRYALSTAAIGQEFGRIHRCAPISKNAVVGKAHRLGLPPRESPILRVSSGPRAHVPMERKRSVVGHVPVRKTLQPLKSVETSPLPPARREPRTVHVCSWPIGHPGTKGFCFCSSVATFGKPYCAEHAERAYLKTG